MDYKQGVVELTQHKDVLEKLRGMRLVRQFQHHNEPLKNANGESLRDDSGAVIQKPIFKEGFQTQFNGQFIVFYLGEPRVMPLNVADSLERTHITHLLEKCVQCKGTGTSGGNICLNCKGRKKIIKESDDGQELKYRILKVTRRFDAMLFDPATSQPLGVALPPSEPEPEEAAVADA